MSARACVSVCGIGVFCTATCVRSHFSSKPDKDQPLDGEAVLRKSHHECEVHSLHFH